MKRKLSYQEFLKMDLDFINERYCSLTEHSLYFYHKTVSSSSDIYQVNYSLPDYTAAGEYQFLLGTLKSAFEEVFPLSDKKEWQEYFKDDYDAICDAISEFNKENANYLIVGQDTYNTVMQIAIDIFDLLERMGYDLERFYLADIYSTL